MIRFSIVLIVLVFLSGCRSDTNFEIFKDGTSIQVIKDEATKDAITQAFEKKTEVVFKKRPDFEYVIKVENGDEVQEWLYSNMGVITKKGSVGTIYKVGQLPSQVFNKSSN